MITVHYLIKVRGGGWTSPRRFGEKVIYPVEKYMSTCSRIYRKSK